VSVLQYFHHIGAPIDCYLLIAYKNEGLWIFLQFNSLIHSVMYMYYGFSALEYRMPLKWLLTLLQLLQLTSGNFISSKYLSIGCYKKDPYRIATWTVNMFYVGMLTVLFIHFFITSYLQHDNNKKSLNKSKSKSKQDPSAPSPNNTDNTNKTKSGAKENMKIKSASTQNN